MPRPTYADYIARAAVALAEGFRTKAARKDALDDLNRAFDYVRQSIGDSLLAERDAAGIAPFKESKEWNVLYNGRPELAHWKPKHATLFAAYPEAVQRANRLAELRAAIKAAPELPRATPARIARQRAKDEKARTCQICGRLIFAETGLIAHHGYTRPGDGWQTASCPGARELPYEADKAVLVQHVANIRAQLESLIAAQGAAIREESPVHLYWTTRTAGAKKLEHCEVTRGTFNEMRAAHMSAFLRNSWTTFDQVKAQVIAERARKIEQTADYLKHQEGRANAWRQVERWNATTAKWESV